jgi:cobalt-zinc-cadmium efflux system membrane fusion protein
MALIACGGVDALQNLLPSPLSGLSRPLPRRVQLAILGGVALVMAVLLLVVPAIRAHLAAPPEAAVAPPAPGTFRPTDEQWASLKIAPVEEMTFRAERVTDGKIANNDDTTTPVFSPFSGRVTKLFVKAGDHVDKGAPLLAIEASEFVQAQNDLISAAASLRKARSQLGLAQTNEKRQHELYEAKAGALKDWEQSKNDLAAAQSDVRSAEIALAAVRNRLRILGKSNDEIAALETARETVQQMGAEAIVSAPISGTVTQRQVGLGQYINSASNGASNPIFAIGNLSTLWLLANVRETDAPLMRLGAAVDVRVLAYPGRAFKAKLTYVAPAIDPNTHRLPVRAEVENPDGALKPEMFASFSISTGGDATAPAVPEDAIVYEGETARVWVARDDKSLELRQVRVGRISDGKVEVLAGLDPGAKVVTSGTVFIDRAAKGD